MIREGGQGWTQAEADNVARLTVVRFLSMVGGFLASVLGARLLGADGMGAVGTALTVAMLAAVTLSGGLSLSTIYHLSRWPEQRSVAIGRLIVLGAMTTILDLVLVGLVALSISAVAPEIGGAILLAAPLSATILAFDLGGSILLGMAAQKAYIGVQFAEAAIGLVAVAIVVLLVASTPAGFLFATVVGYAVGAMIAFALVRRRAGPIRLGWDRAFAREVLSFGLRGQLGNILQFLNTRLDLLLVSTFLGLTAAGLYYVAVRISEAVLLVAQAGATLLFPRVAAQSDRTSTEATEALVRSMLLVVGGGALTVVLVGEPFIRLVFGDAFGDAAGAARIVAVAMIPFAVHRLLAGDLRGRGRPGLVSASSAIALVVTVILDVTLIPLFGIEGAAVASLAAYGVAAAALLLFFTRTTGAAARDLVPGPRDVAALARHGSMVLVAFGLRSSGTGRGTRGTPP